MHHSPRMFLWIMKHLLNKNPVNITFMSTSPFLAWPHNGNSASYQFLWETIYSYGGDTTIYFLFVFTVFVSAVLLFLSEACGFPMRLTIAHVVSSGTQNPPGQKI